MYNHNLVYQIRIDLLPVRGSNITLFRCITILCGNDNINKDIPHNHTECGDIPQNIVSSTEHCYGSHHCYEVAP